MNILKTTPKGWATDDILVPNIMESMDTTAGQDFVFTVSVQGHGDYPTEPTLENPEIKVTGVEDEGKRNAWEYYVNEVHEMDKFVAQGMNRQLSYFTEIICRRLDWRQRI